MLSSSAQVINIIRSSEEDANLIITPSTLAAANFSTYTSIVNLSTQFLSGVISGLGIADGTTRGLIAVLGFITQPKSLGSFGKHLYHGLSGVPEIYYGLKSWHLYQTGASYSVILPVAALGLAITAAMDFAKSVDNWYDTEDESPSLASKRRDVLLQALKLAGWCVIASGPAGFGAGAIILGIAALIGLYNHYSLTRNLIDYIIPSKTLGLFGSGYRSSVLNIQSDTHTYAKDLVENSSSSLARRSGIE